jgi:hypothetical protein
MFWFKRKKVRGLKGDLRSAGLPAFAEVSAAATHDTCYGCRQVAAVTGLDHILKVRAKVVVSS